MADISVYGVSVPRHEGRAGCAAIVVEPGAELDLEGFAAFAKRSLPKYAVPLFVRIIPEMPKTENNKLMKGSLKNEGADPSKMPSSDKLYWLKNGWGSGKVYEELTCNDWADLGSGRVSL